MGIMLVSDYDKTLYVDDESIRINIEKIKEFRSQGNIFAVATGRTYMGLINKIETYNINFDYLILCQGAVLLNRKKQVMKYYNIDNNIVENIVSELKQYRPFIKRIDICDLFHRGVDLNSNTIVTKIVIVLRNLNEGSLIISNLNEKYHDSIKAYLLSNKTDCIEIISNSTSKAEGIRFIADKEQIEYKDIYVIGDANNDLEMIQDFSGYGMINSEEIVKVYAKKLYPNVCNLIDDINNRG